VVRHEREPGVAHDGPVESSYSALLPADRPSSAPAARRSVSGRHSACAGLPLLRGSHQCLGLWLVELQHL